MRKVCLLLLIGAAFQSYGRRLKDGLAELRYVALEAELDSLQRQSMPENGRALGRALLGRPTSSLASVLLATSPGAAFMLTGRQGTPQIAKSQAWKVKSSAALVSMLPTATLAEQTPTTLTSFDSGTAIYAGLLIIATVFATVQSLELFAPGNYLLDKWLVDFELPKWFPGQGNERSPEELRAVAMAEAENLREQYVEAMQSDDMMTAYRVERQLLELMADSGIEYVSEADLKKKPGKFASGGRGLESYADFGQSQTSWQTLQTEDGRKYYYNEKTGETSWDAPAPPKPILFEQSQSWTPITDPDGKTYYWNEATGETAWERPSGVSADGVVNFPAGGSGQDGGM